MNKGSIIDGITDLTKVQDLEFSIGDSVTVHFTLHEDENKTTQRFKGLIIADKGRGINRNITVRHLTGGIGVERVFPLNSGIIEQIEVTRQGDVARSKLYYLRDRIGKAATTVKEKRFVQKSKKSKKG